MHLNGGFYRSFRHTACCLFPVNGQLCALDTNQLANSLAGVEMHAQKKKPTNLVRRRNTPTFKHYERLQQVFGYAQISQRRTFQEGG